MKITKPYNNEIIVIENFLSEEEADLINSLVEAKTEEDWEADRLYNNEFFNAVIHFTHPISGEIGDRVVENIMPLLPDGVILKSFNPNSVTRTEVGKSMAPHNDWHDDNGCRYGIVIYINENYTGGEIYYPNKGIYMKPGKGLAVVHPASEEYLHGIKEVTSGVRYAMTMFAFDEDKVTK
jgi:hypothetical protein